MRDLKNTKDKAMRKNSILQWTIITLFLVIVILIGFFYDINKVTDRLIDRSIIQQEVEKELSVSRSLDLNLDTLERIADRLTSSNLDNAKYVYLLCRQYIDSGQFEYLNFADKTGKLYYNDKTVTDISMWEDFQNAMKGENTISSPIRDEKSGKMLVRFTVPVRNQQGIQGVLVGSRLVADVEREILGEETTKTASVIVDDKQIITFTTLKQADRSYSNDVWEEIQESGITFSQKDVELMKANILQGVSGKIRLEGTDFYVSYVPLSARTGWTLVSFIIDTDYGVYRKSVYSISVGSIFLAILVIALFCYYVIRLDKKKAEELYKVELIDGLTNVGNKNAFYEMLTDTFRHHDKKTYIIFLFDIHNFKLINYNYTYQQGDRVLCCIADSLKKIVSQKDRISRQSSDCFAILVEKDAFDEKVIMQTLLEDIHAKLGAGIARAIRFSAGYYEVTDRKEDIRNMVDKATVAWKCAKEREENCVAYNETILLEQLKIKQIEDSQTKALLTDEFKVYLQPKVDLRKSTICGAEALVRWISKDLGFMAPDEFIPVVEANGFIKVIDFYVLQQVCKDIRHRLDQREKVVPISVNQSRITILDDEYLKRIRRIIDEYQIPVKYLDFEVTESLFIGDYKTIIQILTQIHEMGISISMDDFGSGYSSLNLLKNMSIDNLKIDKEFLAESEKSDQSKVIIKSLIEMARELDIRVVCEGVEQKEQVEFLKNIQCDEAQGYYYDRPISAQEFYRKLSEGRYEDLCFDTKPAEDRKE